MGGGIVLQYAMDYPMEVSSITLINPLSPFGYSGTKDDQGTCNNQSYSGTGAGTVNTSFVQALKDKVKDASIPTSATAVLKSYFAPDYKISPEWPFTAPGDKGIAYAMSPKYVNLLGLTDINPKPPILWFRGAKDSIVSDTSLLDIGYLGKLGYVPGWSGD